MRNKRRSRGVVFSFIFAAAVMAVMPVNVFAEEEVKQEAVQADLKTNEIIIDDTNFPDQAFREYILTNFDTDKDDKLSAQEIESAKIIAFEWDDTVMSLEGLDYFTNLEELCTGTNISELDVSKLPNLKKLDCSYAGAISSLDVTKNSKLEILWCYETQIASLDVSQNPNLIRLDCNHTQVTELNVQNNPKLFALNCEDTSVDTLDISKNPELYEVYITNTPISEMDYSHNPELVHVRVAGTLMTEIDITKNPKVAALYCSDTAIKELNLSNNPEMFEIFCYNTPIATLDLSKFAGLRTVEAYNTNITQIDISNNTNLAGLDISNTKVSSLDVSHNSELRRLTINDTNIAKLDLSQNKLISKLSLANTKIEELDVTNAVELVGINCAGSKLTWLDLSKAESLWYEGVVSPQNRTVYCAQSSAGREFDIHTIVADISKVTVEAGQGYSYDANTGMLTVTDDKITEIKYSYDHGYNLKELPPMEVTLKLNKIYKMLSESTQKFEGKDMQFTSECSLDKFEKVLVDGNELSSEFYTVKEGSTIVTLKAEFLKTLSAGEHVIQIVSADGLSEGKIVIENVAAPGGGPEKAPGQTIETQDAGSKNVPQTGDRTSAALSIGGCVLALGVILKRRSIMK